MTDGFDKHEKLGRHRTVSCPWFGRLLAPESCWHPNITIFSDRKAAAAEKEKCRIMLIFPEISGPKSGTVPALSWLPGCWTPIKVLRTCPFIISRPYISFLW